MEDENVRKYVTVKIGDKDGRLQLDCGSDLSIINHHTWCKIGKTRMMRTKKVARSVSGERIRFEGEVTTNVTLKENTLKLKMFVLSNTNNLLVRTGSKNLDSGTHPLAIFVKKLITLHLKLKTKERPERVVPQCFFRTNYAAVQRWRRSSSYKIMSPQSSKGNGTYRLPLCKRSTKNWTDLSIQEF